MASRFRTYGLTVAAALMLCGCATYDLIKPAPGQQQPIRIVYSNSGASVWSDLPMGTYQVPGSEVIISGHQGGGGIGLLFGVVGVLAQSAVDSGVGKAAVSNVQDALRVDLTDEAQSVTASLVGTGKFATTFSIAAANDAPMLTVVHYVVLTFVNDTDVRPYVLLKATLTAPGADKSLWTARYIASTGAPRPLEGENSYTANNGALLKAALSDELVADIRFMLTDVATPYPRDETKLIYVETSVPFVKQKVGMTGSELTEDDKWIVVAPRVGDLLVFAGVNVMDKSVTLYRPATGDDGFKFLDEPKQGK